MATVIKTADPQTPWRRSRGALRLLVAPLLLSTLLFALAACGEEQLGYLRVINLSVSAREVDVGFDGERRVGPLAYGTSSGYMATSVGALPVRVVRSEGSAVLVQQTLEMGANERRTLFLFDSIPGAPVPEPVEGQDPPLEDTGTTGTVTLDDDGSGAAAPRLRFVHAVQDLGELELTAAKQLLFSKQSYQTAPVYVSVPEAKPALVVALDAGETVIALKPLTLDSKRAYTLVLFGTDLEEDDFPVVARIFDDTAAADPGQDPDLQDARLTVFHASPGADQIYAEVDGSQVTSSSLGYLQGSAYTTVKAGLRKVTLRVATGDTVFYETTQFFRSAGSYTIAVADVPKQIKAVLYEDKLPILGAGKGGLRVLQLSPDTPTLDVKVKGDVASLFFGLRFKDGSGFSPLPAGSHDLEVYDSQSGALLLDVLALPLKDGVAHTLYLRGSKAAKTFGYTLSQTWP